MVLYVAISHYMKSSEESAIAVPGLSFVKAGVENLISAEDHI